MNNKYWYYGEDAISSFNAIEEPEKVGRNNQIEVRVTELMHEVGIPAHIKGYNYLRTAILLVINDPDIIHYMMSELYVKVAEQYNTTASRVERAIRFALVCGWNKLFLGEVESDDWDADYKPSNSEFIAAVADKVKLEFEYASKPRYAAGELLEKK